MRYYGNSILINYFSCKQHGCLVHGAAPDDYKLPNMAYALGMCMLAAVMALADL
jgi:hypothetical protein